MNSVEYSFPSRPTVERVADHHRQGLEVALEEEPAPAHAARGRSRNTRPQHRRVVAVLAREEPVAAALEHRHVPDLGRDGRHELHRAGPGADDRDALAVQVDVVVPARRVHRRACEVVGAGDRRDRRGVQLARGEHDGVGLPAAPVLRLDRPGHRRLVEPDRGHQHGRHEHLVDARTRFATPWRYSRISALRRAQPRPVAALGERERVQVARDVARRARVAVVEPGAADLRRAVEDHDVGDAVAAELDRRGDAAEARADHDDPCRRPLLTPVASRHGPDGIRSAPLLAGCQHDLTRGATPPVARGRGAALRGLRRARDGSAAAARGTARCLHADPVLGRPPGDLRSRREQPAGRVPRRHARRRRAHRVRRPPAGHPGRPRPARRPAPARPAPLAADQPDHRPRRARGARPRRAARTPRRDPGVGGPPRAGGRHAAGTPRPLAHAARPRGRPRLGAPERGPRPGGGRDPRRARPAGAAGTC